MPTPKPLQKELGRLILFSLVGLFLFGLWTLCGVSSKDPLHKYIFIKYPQPTLNESHLRLFVRGFHHGGRLGNCLFQYATLLGVARRNNRAPLWSPDEKYVQHQFNIRMKIDVDNKIATSPQSNFLVIQAANNIIYNNATERLPQRNISLKGAPQSRCYFEASEAELREEFTFKKKSMDSAVSFLKNATPPKWSDAEHTKVVIHVRRTDMDSKELRGMGWDFVEADFFRRAMDYFSLQHYRVLFVVLSDDLAWCREHIRGPHVVYSEGHTPATDLAIASLCDHAVVTKGTYGLWVAWFANGVTVRPKDYPPINTTAYHMLKSQTHYFPRYSVLL